MWENWDSENLPKAPQLICTWAGILLYFPTSQKLEHTLPFLTCFGLVQKILSLFLNCLTKEHQPGGKGHVSSLSRPRLEESVIFRSCLKGPPFLSLTSLLHQWLLRVPSGWLHWPCRSQPAGFHPESSRYQSQTLQRPLMIAKYILQSHWGELRRQFYSWLPLGLVPSRETNKQL